MVLFAIQSIDTVRSRIHRGQLCSRTSFRLSRAIFLAGSRTRHCRGLAQNDRTMQSAFGCLPSFHGHCCRSAQQKAAAARGIRRLQRTTLSIEHSSSDYSRCAMSATQMAERWVGVASALACWACHWLPTFGRGAPCGALPALWRVPPLACWACHWLCPLSAEARRVVHSLLSGVPSRWQRHDG